MRKFLTPFLLLIFLLIVSCSNLKKINNNKNTDSAPKNYNTAVYNTPNAVPKKLPKSRYGNPKSYTALGQTYYVRESAHGFKIQGKASWYGTKFHGRRTSSGEPYDMFAMTAAMRTVPIPAFAKVTNLENGKEVIVKVNDRGPFKKNRVIDLSYVAAKKLGIVKKGTGEVSVEIINTQPKYFVQAGAYSSILKAEQVTAQLKPLTTKTITINPLIKQNQTLYRVQIGPLDSNQQSNTLIKDLQLTGYNHPMRVVRG